MFFAQKLIDPEKCGGFFKLVSIKYNLIKALALKNPLLSFTLAYFCLLEAFFRVFSLARCRSKENSSLKVYKA